MEEKDQINNNAEDFSRTNKIAEKNARIQAKSDRINARSERIAKRNGTYFTPEIVTGAEKTEPEPDVCVEMQENSSTTSSSAVAEYQSPSPSPSLRKKKKRSFNAAMVLSSVSILLLLTLFFGISLGLISIDGIRVVYLNMTDKTPPPENELTSPTAMIEDFKNSVVIVSAELEDGTSTGTGIIVSSDGYIATNYHVVDEAKNIFVKLYKSDGYAKAELIGFSKHDDIAVLKINKDGLRPAAFASDCTRYLAGEKVFAIGAPDGTDYSWTVTQGIISAVNRDLKFYGSDGVLTKKWRVMQTDTPVNPGNSGGPLVDSNGTVVGIIAMKIGNTEGMGFALPADGAIEIIAAIIEKGSADHIVSSISSGRPLIGVTCVAVEANVWYKHTDAGIEFVTESYASAHPDTTFLPEESGVYVKYTDPSRDAHGKLIAGDIITEVNGFRVYTQHQLMNELYNFREGDSVTITFYRDGKYHNVSITLIEAEIQ